MWSRIGALEVSIRMVKVAYLLYKRSIFLVTAESDKELCVSILLSVPVQSLLPSLPSSTAHNMAITFDTDSDPTLPLRCIFGDTNTNVATPTMEGGGRYMKQSVSIVPVHLNPKENALKQPQISPVKNLGVVSNLV